MAYTLAFRKENRTTLERLNGPKAFFTAMMTE